MIEQHTTTLDTLLSGITQTWCDSRSITCLVSGTPTFGTRVGVIVQDTLDKTWVVSVGDTISYDTNTLNTVVTRG